MFVLSIIISSVALGYAIQLSNGAYSPEAFRWVMLGFVAALVPALVPSSRAIDRRMRPLVLPAIGVGLAFQFSVLAVNPPAMYLGREHPLAEFQSLLAVAAVLSGIVIARAYHRLLVAFWLLLFAALGFWTLVASPKPHIDVFFIHQESLAALWQGIDPYTITFPNPYRSTQWFAPGVATVDRLLFGYVYPAWTLLVAVPGYLLMHDYRYSFLAAIVALAALGVQARPSAIAVGGIGLFLFTPRGFFVLEQGWTEPSLLIGVAISVYAAARGHHRLLLPVGLGIVACAKQYSILAAPAALLLLPLFPRPRDFWIMIAKALGIAMVLTLPLALRHPASYWRNVFGIQFTAPLRNDALSIPSYWIREFGSEIPRWFHLGGWLLLSALTVVRAPRTAAGFAWAGGTLYLIFFMFRQGFANYYYVVIGIYALAIAAAGFNRGAAADRRPLESS